MSQRLAASLRRCSAPSHRYGRLHGRARQVPIALPLIGLGLLLLFGTGPALAGKGAASLPSRVGDAVNPRERLALEDAISGALREQQYEVASPTEREAIVQSEPTLKGCTNEACLERLGRLLGVQVLVRAAVDVKRPSPKAAGAWTLSVEVFDVEVGASGAKLDSPCPDCSSEQATQMLGDLVRRAVLESAARPRGTLIVTSDPTSAIVFVDSTELGNTPYKRVAFVGKHRLIVKRLGHISHQSDVEVAEDQKQAVAVKLVPGKDTVEIKTITIEKPSTPVYKKWWFWVTVAGAAAIAGGGIAAGAVLGSQPSLNGEKSMNHFSF